MPARSPPRFKVHLAPFILNRNGVMAGAPDPGSNSSLPLSCDRGCVSHWQLQPLSTLACAPSHTQIREETRVSPCSSLLCGKKPQEPTALASTTGSQMCQCFSHTKQFSEDCSRLGAGYIYYLPGVDRDQRPGLNPTAPIPLHRPLSGPGCIWSPQVPSLAKTAHKYTRVHGRH